MADDEDLFLEQMSSLGVDRLQADPSIGDGPKGREGAARGVQPVSPEVRRVSAPEVERIGKRTPATRHAAPANEQPSGRTRRPKKRASRKGGASQSRTGSTFVRRVRPADSKGARAERSRKIPEVSAEDAALFEASIGDLDGEVLRDKEREADGGEASVPGRVRLSRRTVPRIDRRLDLHGATMEEARHRLRAFLAEAAAHGARTVLVVTGKGRNSPGGRGILRASVETWLRRRTSDRVDRWAEAPRALGGSGAFVLWLRRRPREES